MGYRGRISSILIRAARAVIGARRSKPRPAAPEEKSLRRTTIGPGACRGDVGVLRRAYDIRLVFEFRRRGRASTTRDTLLRSPCHLGRWPSVNWVTHLGPDMLWFPRLKPASS